jgi:hypothetical protein
MNSRKKFFRQLEAGNQETSQTDINTAEFHKYWSDIWAEPKTYNQEATWIEVESEQHNEVPSMDTVDFNKTEILNSVKKTSNWKAPGPDHLHNFWIKCFTTTHEPLARSFSALLNNPEKIPHFLMVGNTFLLHKKGDTSHPANYRPITCLSVIYKLLTSLINNKIYQHCEENNLIAEEQKGCIRNSLGCKHQLTIDAVVLKQATTKQRNLHMAYIDYSKAFDSVPHDWLLKVLQMYRVCPKIQKMLDIMMRSWKIKLHVDKKNVGNINIKRGIFQGDSLSPMWFCLALNPMSRMLNRCKIGYKIIVEQERRLNHMLYMDDLKLYAETRQKLKSLITTVNIFSKDINMSFGLDECAGKVCWSE